MTAVSPEASKYFQLMLEHKMSDAEKELEGLRQPGRATEWGKGYLKALEGLHVSERTGGEKYLYLTRERFEGEQAAELRKEFLAEAENEHHGDYDRGYFKALADFMTYLHEGKSPRAEEKRAKSEPRSKRRARDKLKKARVRRKTRGKKKSSRRRK